MKRLTDLQIKHQQQGRARIREAVQEAKNVKNLCLYTYTGTSFVALGQFQPMNWINGIKLLPFDYTII